MMENINMKHWWNYGTEMSGNGSKLDDPNNKEQMQTTTRDRDQQLPSRQFHSKEAQERKTGNRQQVGK